MAGLLAIDVGLVTAWTFGNTGCERPEWGHHIFESRYEPEIGWLFWELVDRLITTYRPGFLGIELPWMPRDPKRLNNNVLRLIYMSRAAMAISYGHGLKVRTWSISEVAEFLRAPVSPSAAKKAATKAIIETRYGWTPIANFDESDSNAVWLRGEADLDPEASAARGIGELFTADVMKPNPRRKRVPAQPPLAL